LESLEILIELLRIKVYGFATHHENEAETLSLNFVPLKNELINKMGRFEFLLQENKVVFLN